MVCASKVDLLLYIDVMAQAVKFEDANSVQIIISNALTYCSSIRMSIARFENVFVGLITCESD